VDAFTLRAPGETVIVGKEPSGVALSADGKRAVVVNAADNTLSVVDTATRSTVATIKVDEPGADLRSFAVALSPEGTRAYVAGRRTQSVFKPDALSIVDVDKGVVVEVIDMGASSTAVALTPQGDHLYWAASASNVSPPDAQLFSMQFGKRLPAEWNLTSGTVSPLCYPEPHRVIARLGDFRQVETQMPTTLSQVVPVAPLCSFDFSFEALATQPSAVAEVFWIDADCGLLRTDQVPIESLRTPSESVSFQLLSAMLKQALDERPPLVFHRRRLSAPEGAAQAEVRFNVPPDILALVGLASLVGTDEALQNSDLALLKEGSPTAGDCRPPSPPASRCPASGTRFS
jgi:YVTN family beta-propeller protein